MPLSPEQIYKALKLDGKTFETEDELVSEFSKQWNPVGAPVDDATKDRIIGGLMGSLETEVKRELKSLGLEYVWDKAKKVQENITEGIRQLNQAKLAEIEDLKAKNGDGSDTKIQALQADIDKWKNKFNEEKSARELAVTEAQNKYSEYEGKLKTVKKDFHLTKTFEESIKWKSGITDLEKKGFDKLFNEKYSTDLDEKDTLIITDKSGKQIPNPKVAGTFLSVSEVLEMEGVANKVWEINPHKNNNQQRQDPQNPTTVVTPPAQGGRTIAPRITGTSSVQV